MPTYVVRWCSTIMVAAVTLGNCWALELSDEAARALILKLSADDFITRETALAAIVAAGDGILPYLGEAQNAGDPELRLRAGVALRKLLEVQHKRNLQAFVADRDGNRKTTLPGWEKFREQYGTKPAVRALYHEMYCADGALLSRLTEGAAADELLHELYQLTDLPQTRKVQFPSCLHETGRIAVTLWALEQPAKYLKEDLRNQLGKLALEQLRDAQDDEYDASLRALVFRWMQRNPPQNYLAAQWSLRHAIRLGVGTEVVEMILAKEETQKQTVVYYALVAASHPTICKQINEKHVSKYLVDTRSVHPNVEDAADSEVRLEVRDCALYQLLLAKDLAPTRFEMTLNLKANALSVTPSVQIPFRNHERRIAAHKKWQESNSSD
jgi:hypothetical protein